MARHEAVYVMMAAFMAFCGCETIGAFGTGRVTPSDVAYITHAGTIGTKTALVDVNSIEADEAYDAPPASAGRGPEPKRRASTADQWIEEYLW